MAASNALVPSAELRKEIYSRGGGTASRCYQCATCTSVCELSTVENLFPRRQMLFTQWGLGEKLAADPAVWLCHQCNDCTVRCPRDAKPGDVMQIARGLAIEELAFPRFVGKLVGNARTTWALLLAVPFAFWVTMVWLHNGLTPPSGPEWAYGDAVPHWLIYAVYFPALLVFAGVPAVVGGMRAWKKWGEGVERKGSFVRAVMGAVTDIITHKRFGSCGKAAGRKWGHFLLLWGFVLAATTSGFLIVWLYGYHLELPGFSARCESGIADCHLPLGNWMKIMGNAGAVFLVLGGLMILFHRLRADKPAGRTTAFDNLLLTVVLLVIVTGVGAEVLRLMDNGQMGLWVYIIHLSAVLCLFLSIPFSKFAHLIYRTLAMVHERMVAGK